MAVVPNLWGHGALLILIIVPGGVTLAHTLLFNLQWRFVLPAIPLGMGIYYRVWKYAVGFLNEELRIARCSAVHWAEQIRRLA